MSSLDMQSRLQFLFEKYVLNTCSKQELEELMVLVKDLPEELLEILKQEWTQTSEAALEDEPKWKIVFDSIINETKRIEPDDLILDTKEVAEVYPIGKRRGKKWMQVIAVAASLLIILTGWWFFYLRYGKHEIDSGVVTRQPVDIAPGGNKAILTLADGRKVVLDAVNKGTITKQGGVTVIKVDDGELSYASSSDPNDDSLNITFNTITTPRGGQYQLVLSDGTKVWLNAASSLKFPTVFSGSERKVEITGEGYFEVAHNKKQPFLVSAAGIEISVLGTHFNINAYEDEPGIKTTLLEGSVKVSSLNQSLIIAPGQQATFQSLNRKLQAKNNVDLGQVVAWKNGYFSFDNMSFQDIMRNLSRWYDLDVVYEGRVPNIEIGGKMGRDVRLSKLLEFLQSAGVQFRIDGAGRKLVVINGK